MPAEALRILHVLRAPVGGLFRHVTDLAAEQTARGHSVGIVADASTGGEAAAKRLAEFSEKLSLRITRVAMSRDIGASDGKAIAHVNARAAEDAIDVLHGHGAKGGAYVRLSSSKALKVYTPHGGSLHYSALSPVGFAYLASERLMKLRTDLFLFESGYALRTFTHKLGQPRFARVVHNGIRPDELKKVEQESTVHDFIYLGELRKLKGPDLFIDALSKLSRDGWTGSAALYGDGTDRNSLIEQVADAGLVHQVHFPGPMPAREAFATGEVLVLPSRAESLPYVALEAAGAQIPLVATNVGGLPEIFGPDASRLVPTGDAMALAAAMAARRNDRDEALIGRLHERVSAQFSVSAMTDGVLSAYSEALKNRS